MSVQTTYDEMRDRLRNDLDNCLEQSIELLKTKCWGYDEMRSGYAIELYQKIMEARDAV
jgi:hypothetical protein